MDNHGFKDLNKRAKEIFRYIVDAYVQTGKPISSRTISKSLEESLSPATIRNVMADLEDLGLLAAPHISAGRLPTDAGLRYFIDGILEMNSLSPEDQAMIDQQCKNLNESPEKIYKKISTLLSGLSSTASLVVAPKHEKSIKHIEFVSLEPGKALAILVPFDGVIENRIVNIPPGVTPDHLKRASNFLSERLNGKTFQEMQSVLEEDIEDKKREIDDLTKQVIKQGLAFELPDGQLIVSGRAHLINSQELENVDRLKRLLEHLESKETLSKLIEHTVSGHGVKIFIGSENPIFNESGYSLIIRPYTDEKQKIIGAVGVVGPMRLNYARVIPSVNYTAEIITKYFQNLT